MIAYILVALASIFKAIMDTVNFHYSTSVFQNLNPKFWNLQVSSQGKKFLGIETIDAWHLSQYAVYSLLFAAILLYKSVFGYYDFLIFWGIYFIVFQIFYSIILIKK